MTHITPYALWLGHAGDGRNYPVIHREGIQAAIQLAAEDTPDRPPRDLVHCRFPLSDGSGNSFELLRLAVTSITHMLENEMPTLVYCGAGMSRSPAIAAVAMAFCTRRQLDECLRHVARHRRVDVSPDLWSHLHEMFDVLLG